MNNTISPTDRQEWEENGFLKVSGFLTADETRQLQAWAEDISNWPADDDKWLHHFEKTVFGVRPARTEYLIDFHEGIRGLLTQGKVPATAGELMGDPVLLYKEKINYKYPGGGGYAAHQDAPAYEFVKKHITCSIAIDAATPENGCLYFVPGMHQDGLLPMDEQGCLIADDAKKLNWQAVPMNPGDALFFSSYAPHQSPPNRTGISRRTLYLTYNAKSEGDLRERYYADKRRSLAENQLAGNHLRISKIGHFQGQPGVPSDLDVDPSLTNDLYQAATPSEKVDKLFEYLRSRGSSFYDESVTQLAHGLQAAHLARSSAAPSEQVVAALLHDVGHFLMDEQNEHSNFLTDDWYHEEIGALVLEPFFPATIVDCIRLHVPAKRYLCAVEESYFNSLSQASKRSLELQGGKMSADQQKEFESHPNYQAAVRVRRWDDGAKVADLDVPGLESYREEVETCLLN